MQILYGAIQIANEPPGGTDGVLGFQAPKGAQNVQWVEGLRAPDAYPLARFNRKRTLSGSIYPAPLLTLVAAKLAREQFYELLPASGPLVLSESSTSIYLLNENGQPQLAENGQLLLNESGTTTINQITTYAYAVLENIEVIEAVTEGVSYGLKLTFAVGPPTFSNSNANLVTSTGQLVVTSTGAAIRI